MQTCHLFRKVAMPQTPSSRRQQRISSKAFGSYTGAACVGYMIPTALLARDCSNFGLQHGVPHGHGCFHHEQHGLRNDACLGPVLLC